MSLKREDLRRSRDERVIAGVAGGVARKADPTLLRGVFVVLVPVFGLGVIAYLVLWAFSPVDDELQLPRSRPSSVYLMGLGLLSVGSLLVTRLFTGGILDKTAPASLVVVAGLLLLWASDELPARERSGLPKFENATTATSAGVLLLVVGVLGVLQLGGVVSLHFGSIAAIVLVAIGVAVGAGAWGKPWPGLAATGTLLALGLGIVTVIDTPLGDGIGDRTITPESVAELVDAERLTMGSLVLDLSELEPSDFAEARSQGVLIVSASVTVGDLRVILPAGLEVEVEARVGTGQMTILNRSSKGVIVERSYPNEAATVILDLQVGLGSVLLEQEISDES